MKKIISLLLVLVMVLSLAACAGNQPAETDPVETDPVETDPVETDPTETTEAPITVMTHADFVAAELDSQVVIETYVQTIESWWDGSCHIYALSEDGGYYIYQYACTEEEAAALFPGTKIRVTGYKTEWAGEVEIGDATIEILEGSYMPSEPKDVTALLGTDELAAEMNDLVAFKGLTVVASTDANGNEAPYLYKWDGSGAQGDDLYFKVSNGTEEFTFTVNVYMLGTGVDSDVYKAVEALQVGDVIDVAGFLYWYEGPQPHLISVTPAA